MAVTNLVDVVNHSQLMSFLFSGKDDNQGNDVSIVPDLIKLHQESSTLYPYAWIDNSVAVPSEAIIKKVEFTGSKEEINLPFDLNGSMVDHWRIGGITKLIMASEKYGTSDRLSFLIDNGILPAYTGKGRDKRHQAFSFFLERGPLFLTGGDVYDSHGKTANDPVTQFITTNFYVPLVGYLAKTINEMEESDLKTSCLESKMGGSLYAAKPNSAQLLHFDGNLNDIRQIVPEWEGQFYSGSVSDQDHNFAIKLLSLFDANNLPIPEGTLLGTLLMLFLHRDYNNIFNQFGAAKRSYGGMSEEHTPESIHEGLLSLACLLTGVMKRNSLITTGGNKYSAKAKKSKAAKEGKKNGGITRKNNNSKKVSETASKMAYAMPTLLSFFNLSSDDISSVKAIGKCIELEGVLALLELLQDGLLVDDLEEIPFDVILAALFNFEYDATDRKYTRLYEMLKREGPVPNLKQTYKHQDNVASLDKERLRKTVRASVLEVAEHRQSDEYKADKGSLEAKKKSLSNTISKKKSRGKKKSGKTADFSILDEGIDGTSEGRKRPSKKRGALNEASSGGSKKSKGGRRGSSSGKKKTNVAAASSFGGDEDYQPAPPVYYAPSCGVGVDGMLLPPPEVVPQQKSEQKSGQNVGV